MFFFPLYEIYLAVEAAKLKREDQARDYNRLLMLPKEDRDAEIAIRNLFAQERIANKQTHIEIKNHSSIL